MENVLKNASLVQKNEHKESIKLIQLRFIQLFSLNSIKKTQNSSKIQQETYFII